MKILIDAIGISKQTDGIGRYSLALLQALSQIDNKNKYTILVQNSLKQTHPVFTLRSKPNFSLIKMNIPSVGPKKQIGFPLILKSKHIHCDLLHSLNSELPIFYNGKSVVTIHDLKYIKYPHFLRDLSKLKSKYLKYVIRKSCQKATRVIADSESTKKDIINLFRIPEKKIKVIYLATDFRTFSFANKRSNKEILKQYSIKKPYFLYIGVKRPHKNLEGLIESFVEFKQKYDKWDTKLVIAGKKYSNYKDYLIKAKQLNIDNEIFFLGFVPDENLKALYSEAEIFLLVSFYEGFGMPILEAMECGTSVITSNISSMSEVAGDAALLIDPYNPQEIAEKMNNIVSNKDLRRKLIEKGFKRVKEFSWKKTARRTLGVYEEIYTENIK